MIQIIPRNLYDDIEYLTSLGISIIPLKSVRDNSKNKDDYKRGLVANWTNLVVSLKELKESLNEGVLGYAIQTGQKSQIFVVDWDNKDITDKSIELKQRLIDCKTLTINTAGGGHHFIFKYQGKLSSIKNHTHLFGNIDIRNNQGCIYFGDRDDGIYAIDNKEVKIQELPDDLLLELKDEIVNKSGRNVRDKLENYKRAVEGDDKKKIEELTKKKYQNGDYVLGIERYFITPDQMRKILDLLTKQDNNYLDNYSKWFIITIILKKLHTGRDNDFKKVWREWSNKSKKYDIDNNNNIWNWIQPEEYDVNVNYIITIINKNLNKVKNDAKIRMGNVKETAKQAKEKAKVDAILKKETAKQAKEKAKADAILKREQDKEDDKNRTKEEIKIRKAKDKEEAKIKREQEKKRKANDEVEDKNKREQINTIVKQEKDNYTEILEQDIPELPQIEKIIYDYKPLTDKDVGLWIQPKSSISVINQRYLSSSLYKNNNHLDIIKSGLGTGKTYSTFKYSIETNTPLLVISHLQSLVSNQVSTYNNLVEKDYINTELDNILKKYENEDDYNQYRYIFKTDLYDVKRVNINKPEDIDITKPIKPEKGDIVYIVYDINTKLEIERMSVSKYHKIRDIYDKEIKIILKGMSKNQKENKMLLYGDIQKRADIGERNSIATTIHSLNRINDMISDVSNMTLYVDEAHRIIHNLFSNDTIQNQRGTIENFISLIKRCKKVIFTDGDYDDLTFQFISSIKMPFNYIENTNKSYDGIDAIYVDYYAIMYEEIFKLIKKGEYFTICCNRKGDVNNIKSYLLSCGVNPEDILVYTSDEGVNVEDANKEWRYKIKVFSPRIVEGVDYTSPTPEVVFVFVGTDKSINCEQIKQQICRNRNIDKVYICFNSLDNNIYYDTEEELKDNINKKRKIFNIESDKIYQKIQEIQDRTYDEETFTFKTKENIISKMYVKSLWIDIKHKTNMKYTLSRLLEGLGFNIIYDIVGNYNKLQDIIDQNKDKCEYVYLNKEIELWDNTKKDIEIIGNTKGLLWNYLENTNIDMKFKDKMIRNLGFIKIKEDIIRKIVNYDKDTIKIIADSLEETDISLIKRNEDISDNIYYDYYYNKLTNIIQNVLANQSYYKMYENVRLLMFTDEILMKRIRLKQQTKINDTCYNIEEYKLYIYKTMMRKYFSNLNIYRLEYTDTDYKDKLINIEKEELDKLNSIYDKSLKKTEMTELELLRILYIIIRKVMGLGYINLKREGAGKRGCKKSNYTNIDSVNNILILLLLGGQILTNNSIDSDIKKIKLNMIDLGQKKIDFIKDED
jgi:hypothetical protein